MPQDTLTTLLALGMASGFISFTIARAKFFESFRDFFFNRSNPETVLGRWIGWLYELISCPYCLSHWVALVCVFIWQPRITNCSVAVIDYIISVFVIVGIASFSWGLFQKLTESNHD